ncbi:MAG: hypothetical protein K9L56_15805, partial [Clostridiales bacterium]|nr:hypothetical protein [Clostridiales bacterium]
IEQFVDETEDRFRIIWETSLKSNVQLITDADQDRVERDLDRIEETFEATIAAVAMRRKIERMAESATQKAISGLRQELQVILGDDFIPPINRRALDKFIKQTISENVSLIQSIASDQHDEIERLIYKGARSGWSMDELEDKIFNQFEISRGRANVVAMDQTGSLQSAVNREIQHNQLDLSYFRWLGIPDNRIRPKHEAIASNIGGEDYYQWSNPPQGIYPGQEVNCRCWAQPYEPEVQEKFGGRIANA